MSKELREVQQDMRASKAKQDKMKREVAKVQREKQACEAKLWCLRQNARRLKKRLKVAVQPMSKMKALAKARRTDRKGG